MTYKLMSVNDLVVLYDKILPEFGFRVKLLPIGQIYYYKGDYKSHSYPDFSLYFETGESQKVEVFELYVEMTYQTYNLHKLIDDADYKLALAVYESYMQDTPREAIDFMYLLAATISDYEAEHYPTAISSTVDFIDHLLEERGQTWHDIHKALGCLDSEDIYSVRGNIEHEFISINDLRALSHFFKLPVQAFIVGGYGD